MPAFAGIFIDEGVPCGASAPNFLVFVVPEVSIPHPPIKSRSAHAVQSAAIHLLLSAAVAGVVAALVFGFWFPAPLRELVGGTELFWLIVGVDVVCGPLLTLVVFNPAKPRAELRRDLALVALIQLLALGYGIHTLAHARPVVLAHEVDRFRVVTYSDLDEDQDANVPDWARPWSLTGVRTVGLRPVANSAEMFASIDASLQGVEPSQRPIWWQDYALSISKVLERARPLAELRAKYSDQTGILNAEVKRATANIKAGETDNPESLVWLPLVSRRVTDWVVFLDPVTARVRGFVHLDGFF